jgi:hypothetical protein
MIKQVGNCARAAITIKTAHLRAIKEELGQSVNSYRNITVILCCLCCRWGRSHAVLVTGGKEFWLPNVGHQIDTVMIEVIRDHSR